MDIVDETGKAIYHPDEAVKGTDLSTHDFMKEMIKNKSGYIEYDWQGRTKVVSYQQAPVYSKDE